MTSSNAKPSQEEPILGFVNKEDLLQYAKGREEKQLLVLELKEIKRYQNQIYLDFPITMSGLFVTKQNRKSIFKDDVNGYFY